MLKFKIKLNDPELINMNKKYISYISTSSLKKRNKISLDKFI